MSKVALITGASRGLGEVVASFLAAQGYDVVITARGEAALQAVADRLRGYGGAVVALAGDVADPAHRQRLAQAAAELGGLHLLFNGASDLGPSPMPYLADYDLARLAEVLKVNLLSPLGLIQQTLPLLKDSGGLVVNISSDAAVAGYEGWGGYGASKAGLDLLSLTLAHELSGSAVSVVAVDPGDMRTQMHQDAFPGEDISDRPLPDVTLPFWAWLLGQERAAINGKRYQAQAERWEV